MQWPGRFDSELTPLLSSVYRRLHSLNQNLTFEVLSLILITKRGIC